MSVAIIDYGSGNLHSARKAFERAAREAGVSQEIKVTARPEDVLAADLIVLPGVGAFADCRRGLEGVAGMVEAMEEAARKRGRPFLGICVGAQLMATRGLEHEVVAGLTRAIGDDFVRACEEREQSGFGFRAHFGLPDVLAEDEAEVARPSIKARAPFRRDAEHLADALERIRFGKCLDELRAPVRTERIAEALGCRAKERAEPLDLWRGKGFSDQTPLPRMLFAFNVEHGVRPPFHERSVGDAAHRENHAARLMQAPVFEHRGNIFVAQGREADRGAREPTRFARRVNLG